MRIVFCASEGVPFAKTGGLADVVGSLPIALEKKGIQLIVIMPLYSFIKRRIHKIKRSNKGFYGTRIGKNIKVYFIDHPKYFSYQGLYGTSSGDYKDNLKRFQFFSSESLQLLKEINVKPDVIHCHDWHSALIPIYLKTREDDFFKKTKSVLTIHNLAYQGSFPFKQYRTLYLARNLFHPESLEYFGQINLLKGGIVYADKVLTVSPTYAKEIMTKKFGCGLESVFKKKQNRVKGILNGLDTNIWNPKKDKFLKKKYDPSNFIIGKAKNKEALQRKMKLPLNKDIPLFSFVGRLTSQKGIDLIIDSMEILMKEDIQLIIQGLGEKRYQDALKGEMKKYKSKLRVVTEFDDFLAHHLYAGSDFFLMPSSYEPCGLSQLISFAYGTLPIVFLTGGLTDTVRPYKGRQKNKNGFGFSGYNSHAYLKCIREALAVYADKNILHQMINNSFHTNYSWDASADLYQRMYTCL